MASESKKQLVQNLAKDIQSYPIVGIVNFENLPAQQLQKMRALLLKDKVKILMARKRLLQLALKESNLKNVEELIEKIKGLPALIFSESNPFALYAIIQKKKSEAPAKSGQRAPKDIIVKAGPTNFAPGPIISELAASGIKTKVEGGKLVIINDVVVAKEGETITSKLAETLKRLEIKPMEIGLELVAVLEDGLVFEAKQLRVDEKEYQEKFSSAANWAMNLAVEISYPSKETMELLLQKAFREAKAVALEGSIINPETKEEILARAEQQALSLKETASIDLKKVQAEEKKS